MAPPMTGHYFRRGPKGSYFAIDDPRAPADANIYFVWEIRRGTGRTVRRKTICLFTTDLDVAEQRVAWFDGPIPMDDEAWFLWQFVRLGRRAQKRLDLLIQKKGHQASGLIRPTSSRRNASRPGRK